MRPIFATGRVGPRVFFISASVHVALLASILFFGKLESRRLAPPDRIIDVVELEEFLPPPPSPAALEPPLARPLAAPAPAPRAAPASAPSRPVATPQQSGPAGLLDEAPTDGSAGAMAAPAGKPSSAPPAENTEPEYLPQFKISDVPVIPAKDVLGRIVYPPLAAKQGIEGTVLLELFIDQNGAVRRVKVLKDPGFGFAEAAVTALSGLVCAPAKMDGKPVPVRFRYPVRFTLK